MTGPPPRHGRARGRVPGRPAAADGGVMGDIGKALQTSAYLAFIAYCIYVITGRH